ncbi:hypothetical protein [Neomegalonema sp.]|uniref:hypothetical protein n=1 Tax=Neomegalonema sp. TaxID=2039713 RepID=UPI00261C9320|nr:hypothetical protein [Neomegalonema sp.]MDD2867715.1 hypothetical protein [Neomegalonema sp.]
MLSREIRHVASHLYDQIHRDSLTIGTVLKACELLAEAAERVEALEGAVLPPALTLPQARSGACEDFPEEGGVVRLDHWRQRARPRGAPSPDHA